MQEEQKHIDKLFSEKLGERTFTVPPSFLADLDARLTVPAAKVGVLGIWYWLSSITVIGIVATGFFFLKPKTQSKSPVTSVAKTDLMYPSNSFKSNDDGLQIKVKNANNESVFVSSTTYSKTPKAFEAGTQAKLVQVKQKVAQKSFIETDSGIENSGSNQKTTANNSSSSKTSAKRIPSKTKNGSEEKSLLPSTIHEKNSNLQGSSFFAPPRTKKEKELIDNLPLNNAAKRLLTEDPDFGQKTAIQSLIANNTSANPVLYFDDTLKKVRYVIRDSIRIIDSLVIRDSVRHLNQEKNNTTKLSDQEKKIRFEVQTFVGFMMVRSKIESPFQTYAEQLEANDKTIVSPEFGFALNAYYKSFTVGSGIQYYHYGETSDFTTNNTITEDSIFIGNTFYQPLYDSSGAVYDSVLITDYDTTQIINSSAQDFTETNTYSRMTIPLRFGYVFPYKNWKFIPRLGMNFEFAVANKTGTYTDQSGNNPFEVTQRNFGMSYQLSLELRREFKNWHVFVNPYYRSNINFLIESPEMNRKYRGMGAVFGVGVKF